MAGALSLTLKVATVPGAASSVTQFLGLARAFRAVVDLIEILAGIAGLTRSHRDHDKFKVALV